MGEGALAAAIAQTLIASSLTRGGTQFVLGSPDASALATDYADLAVVAGANARRVATGGTPEEIDVLVTDRLPSPAIAEMCERLKIEVIETDDQDEAPNPEE